MDTYPFGGTMDSESNHRFAAPSLIDIINVKFASIGLMLFVAFYAVSCVPFALSEENVTLERGAETIRIVTQAPSGMNYLGEVVARGNVFYQPISQIAPEYLAKNAVNTLKNKAYLAGGTVVHILATHTYPANEANAIPDVTYVGAVYR